MSTTTPQQSPPINPRDPVLGSSLNTGARVLLWVLLALVAVAIVVGVYNLVVRARARVSLSRGHSPRPSPAWDPWYEPRRLILSEAFDPMTGGASSGAGPQRPRGAYLQRSGQESESEDRFVDAARDDRTGPSVWSVGTCR